MPPCVIEYSPAGPPGTHLRKGGPLLGLTRIIHELIYFKAKLPAIPGRPRQAMLTVSGDTAARLLPAGVQA